MSSYTASQAKQPLLRSIRDRISMAERLIAHKIRLLRSEQGERADLPLDAASLQNGEARHASVTVGISLRTKKQNGCNPASASAVLEYDLGVVAHSQGPIWVRVERRFKGSSSADIDQSRKRPAPWKLLSESGDLSDWNGDLWASFWPVLMDDLERIVPDTLVEVFADRDLYTSALPGKDFWAAGTCKFNREDPLRLWAFQKAPAVVSQGIASVQRPLEKVAA
jgi:hypothetical protein